MAEKVTIMVLWLKVDLQCSCCHKEVKKILAKFPREIREQKYDEKANTVTITVVCCSPEKIRDKLCCKGAKVIKCIEIKPPKKPEEPKKTEEPKKPEVPKKPEDPKTPKEPEKPKETEKVKVEVIVKPAPHPPAPVPILVFPPAIPGKTCCGPCSDGCGRGPCCPGHKVPPPPQLCSDGCGGGPCCPGHGGRPLPQPCSDGCGGDPCCPGHGGTPPQPCSDGCGGGPCCPGHGVPPPLQPCSDGCGGGPCCPGHGVPPPPQTCSCGCGGYGRGYGCRRVAGCGYNFAEENPQTCSIM